MRALVIIASILVILGLLGSGISGYTLASLPRWLAPVDQTTQFLSNVSFPSTARVNLTNSAQDVRRLADSLPDCISVIVCVSDLKASKSALYDLASSMDNVQVTTGLSELQFQLRQSGQQLYQVKSFVTYVIAFFFGMSVLFILTGIGFLLVNRKI